MKYKSAMICLMTLCLVLTSGVGATAKPKVRKAEGVYVGPTRRNIFGTRDCFTYGGWTNGINPIAQGCVLFEVQPRERYVSVVIDDAAGGPTAGLVWQSNAAGEPIGPDPTAYFCGETKRPIRILPLAAAVTVAALEEDCWNGTASSATVGTIEVSFSAER